MNQPRRWPTRRLQIAIIIILVVSAAIRGFMPPLSREGRAKKLYIDSWYVGISLTGMSNPGSSEKAVKMLEKAIELEPGNSMYEQALVWQYPHEKLPELLRQRSLGKEARILASGLIYEYAEKKAAGNVSMDSSGTVSLSRKVDNKEKLQRLDTLIAADPDNALPWYMRALVYSDMDRPSDMLADVKTANRMGNIKSYKPNIYEEITNSTLGVTLNTDFEDYANYRELARRLANYGNKKLRSGNSDGAVESLEECCMMGVKMASREPMSYISYLVSNAIFSIGWASLEPVYKDLGMEDKLRQYQSVEKSFRNNTKSSNINTDMSTIERPVFFLIFTLYVAGFSLAGLLLALIGWWIMTMVRKKKHQDILNIPAWDEGWLARFFMIAYIPFVVVIGIALISKPLLRFLFDGPGSISVMIVFPLALITAILIIFRRRYIEYTGERIGFWRFVFRVPSSVRAWRDRAFAAMFAGQLLFILCCGSVITLFYKSVYGAHPWQPMRIQYGMMSKEKAMVSKFSSELQKIIVVDSGNNGDNRYKNLKPESE